MSREIKAAGIRISEAEEQETVIEWCELNLGRFPELDLLHHIPNGGKRSKSEAARFRRQGVKAGVPDLFLPVAGWGYHGLYIEMKAIGGKVSPEQKQWIARLKEQGYAVYVAYGAGCAIEILEKYLCGIRKRVDHE